MASTDKILGFVWEDGGGTVLARAVGQDAVAITQASLTSVAWKAFDESGATPDTPVATGTLTIATDIFDTLQTDPRWTLDSTGYNVKHEIAASVFSAGDHIYRVEYVFDPVSGEVFPMVAEMFAKAMRGS